MSTSDPSAQQRDLGAILVGLGALLLFISLFLDWYEPGRNAWAVFEVWDLVLAGLAVAGLAGALARLGLVGERWERGMAWSGGLALVIVVFSLINHPPAADGAGTMIGIWLALIATVVMLGGFAIARARISLVIEVTGRTPPRRGGAGLAGLGALRRHRRSTPPVTPTPPEPPASAPPAGPSPDEEPTRPHAREAPGEDAADTES
jgi:hypothetical protein